MTIQTASFAGIKGIAIQREVVRERYDYLAKVIYTLRVQTGSYDQNFGARCETIMALKEEDQDRQDQYAYRTLWQGLIDYLKKRFEDGTLEEWAWKDPAPQQFVDGHWFPLNYIPIPQEARLWQDIRLRDELIEQQTRELSRAHEELILLKRQVEALKGEIATLKEKDDVQPIDE